MGLPFLSQMENHSSKLASHNYSFNNTYCHLAAYSLLSTWAKVITRNRSATSPAMFWSLVKMEMHCEANELCNPVDSPHNLCYFSQTNALNNAEMPWQKIYQRRLFFLSLENWPHNSPQERWRGRGCFTGFETAYLPGFFCLINITSRFLKYLLSTFSGTDLQCTTLYCIWKKAQTRCV